MEEFQRTRRLLGDAAMDRLRLCRVAVFGIGGVGGYVGEALARSGVGALELFDDDVVAVSNLNRQIVALRSTLGRPKVEVMAERIADICPDTQAVPHRLFYTPETAGQVDLSRFDYVVDAVDTVAAKLELAVARGKKNYDKRDDMAKKDADRKMQQMITEQAEAMGVPYLGAIRRAIAVQEAAALQRSLYEYAPKSKPAADYMDVFNKLTNNRYKDRAH